MFTGALRTTLLVGSGDQDGLIQGVVPQCVGSVYVSNKV